MPHDHSHQHHHHGAHDMDRLIDVTEAGGEVALPILRDAVRWGQEARSAAHPVRRVVDIGSGPGVGTCELARLFPDAQVVAVDASEQMLTRASERAQRLGVGDRVTTRLAELPAAIDDLAPADVVWASMSLHHVSDESAALRSLRDLLGDGGVLVIAEIADPMRVLPRDIGVGRPGLQERLDAAGARWYAQMRTWLTGSADGRPLEDLVIGAGFRIARSDVARVDLPAPLPDDARAFVAGWMARMGEQLREQLDADDLDAVHTLGDRSDPLWVGHRNDTVLSMSNRIVIARPG